jgi:hypothetical protein
MRFANICVRDIRNVRDVAIANIFVRNIRDMRDSLDMRNAHGMRDILVAFMRISDTCISDERVSLFVVICAPCFYVASGEQCWVKLQASPTQAHGKAARKPFSALWEHGETAP